MKQLLVTAGLATFAFAAAAHETQSGPNGGQVVDAGPYHLELVAEQSKLNIFLSDADDKPVDAAGASGRAIIQFDGKVTTILLEAAENNSLSGSLPQPRSSSSRLAVTLTLGNGENLQARFAWD
jgi:hypothetical protein